MTAKEKGHNANYGRQSNKNVLSKSTTNATETQEMAAQKLYKNIICQIGRASCRERV